MIKYKNVIAILIIAIKYKNTCQGFPVSTCLYQQA